MKILLTDDSSTMRRIQKNVLEKLGYTDVTEAEHGADAIDKLKKLGPFDLVLMDWNMPTLSGIEALRLIRADPSLKATPVIMVTSESEKSKILEAIQAGANNYLVKPFQPDALKEKLAAILTKK